MANLGGPHGQIDFTPGELKMLAEVLNSSISSLSMEIADTGQQDCREVLKSRKTALSKALQALE